MARQRVTPIEKLDATIKEVLDEYGEDISLFTQEAVKKVTKAGAKAVRASAKGPVKGKKYPKGWTYKVEAGRLSTTGIIYNGKYAGLAHLLEHGHALRRGGRSIGSGWVDAKVHIAPVEDELNMEFERTVRKAIESAGN